MTVDWPPKGTARYATAANLNGPYVIAIVSSKRVILVNIDVRLAIKPTTSLAGAAERQKSYLDSCLKDMQAAYARKEWDLLQTQAYVISGCSRGLPLMPVGVPMVQAALKKLGLTPKWQGYKVVEDSTARTEGSVAVVIAFQGEGEMPKVYVDDTPLD